MGPRVRADDLLPRTTLVHEPKACPAERKTIRLATCLIVVLLAALLAPAGHHAAEPAGPDPVGGTAWLQIRHDAANTATTSDPGPATHDVAFTRVEAWRGPVDMESFLARLPVD